MTIAVANMQKGKYYTLEIAVPTVVYDNCDMEQSGIGFIIDRDNNTSNENYYYTGEIIAENLIRYTYLCTEDGTHYIHVGGMLTALDDELATTATITFNKLQLTSPNNIANVTTPYTYRYGFCAKQGEERAVSFAIPRYSGKRQERQGELYGSGNAYDFGARMYDSRIGRWFSPDAYEAKYPSISTYAFVANSPILFVDLDGKKISNIELPRSKEYIQIENSLKILKIVNPDRYEEMENSTIDFQISFKDLNPNGSINNPDGSTTTTSGLTDITYTTTEIFVSNIKTDAKTGEVLSADILRFRTLEEQDQWRANNPGKDIVIDGNGNKVIATEEEAKNDIKVAPVVSIYLDNSLKSDDKVTRRKRAKTLAHELFGHAFHDAIKDILKGWLWSKIGNPNHKNGAGHDQFNPGGNEAELQETDVDKNFKDADKEK